ncbi:MAG TPA: OsmC family protein [Tepidisphaeraceae bacterium]|jgi:putative redox protein
MVEIRMTYDGQLRCTATHGPSGSTLLTDAPKDNMGKGEAFSPTDLVATALGTCMLTTMGISAQRHNIPFEGASAKVGKEMVTTPTRRIGKLTVELVIPMKLSEENERRLRAAALTCPVHKSLHPDVQIPVTFYWGPERRADRVEGHD